MLDYRLESRKSQYDNYEFNLWKAVEESRLTLRKNKLNMFLLEKRLNSHNSELSQFEEGLSLEIKPESLSIPSEQIITIISLQDSIGLLYQYLTSNNIDYIKGALYSFRQYFIETIEGNAMQLLAQYKIIDLFAYLLKTCQELCVKYEIIWILINFLASQMDNNDMIVPLMQTEILDVFDQLIQSDLCAICENTLWVLTGLSLRTDEFRSILINHPLYQTTLDLLNKENIDAGVISQGLEFLSKCVSKVDYDKNKDRIIDTLKLFTNNLYSNHTMMNCLRGICSISYLNYDTYEISNIIIDSGVIVKILKTKYQNNLVIILPSLEILASSLFTTDKRIEEILDMNLLDFYHMILDKYNHQQVDYYVTSGLVNIAICNNKIKLTLINSGLFDRVMLLIDKDNENIKSNILQIILNLIMSRNYDIAMILESKGIIEKLLDKSINVCKKNDVTYLKIIFYYLKSFKNKQKNNTFDIRVKQFLTLVECNSGFTAEEMDAILSHDYYS